jgi:hypothetical protein
MQNGISLLDALISHTFSPTVLVKFTVRRLSRSLAWSTQTGALAGQLAHLFVFCTARAAFASLLKKSLSSVQVCR